MNVYMLLVYKSSICVDCNRFDLINARVTRGTLISISMHCNDFVAYAQLSHWYVLFYDMMMLRCFKSRRIFVISEFFIHVSVFMCPCACGIWTQKIFRFQYSVWLRCVCFEWSHLCVTLFSHQCVVFSHWFSPSSSSSSSSSSAIFLFIRMLCIQFIKLNRHICKYRLPFFINTILKNHTHIQNMMRK